MQVYYAKARVRSSDMVKGQAFITAAYSLGCRRGTLRAGSCEIRRPGNAPGRDRHGPCRNLAPVCYGRQEGEKQGKDVSSLWENNLHNTGVLRVGLWKTAETRNTEVLNFLESENITNEIHYYETYQRTIYLDAGGVHTGRASLTR